MRHSEAGLAFGSFRNLLPVRNPRFIGEQGGIRTMFVSDKGNGRGAQQRCSGQYWRNAAIAT